MGVPITEADVRAEKARRVKAKIKAQAQGKANSKSSTPKAGKHPNGTANGKHRMFDDETVSSNSNADDCASEYDDEEILDWCSYINTFDVCITTYNVLQQDFNVARAPPARPRREDVVYSNVEKPRSPLIMCEWYRVIMDEVQMVGGGNTEFVFMIWL